MTLVGATPPAWTHFLSKDNILVQIWCIGYILTEKTSKLSVIFETLEKIRSFEVSETFVSQTFYYLVRAKRQFILASCALCHQAEQRGDRYNYAWRNNSSTALLGGKRDVRERLVEVGNIVRTRPNGAAGVKQGRLDFVVDLPIVGVQKGSPTRRVDVNAYGVVAH